VIDTCQQCNRPMSEHALTVRHGWVSYRCPDLPTVGSIWREILADWRTVLTLLGVMAGFVAFWIALALLALWAL
jgi:hypothetical protein